MRLFCGIEAEAMEEVERVLMLQVANSHDGVNWLVQFVFLAPDDTELSYACKCNTSFSALSSFDRLFHV
jgi:hypothetical protein